MPAADLASASVRLVDEELGSQEVPAQTLGLMDLSSEPTYNLREADDWDEPGFRWSRLAAADDGPDPWAAEEAWEGL